MLVKHKQATMTMNIYNFYDASIIRCSCNRCDNTLLNGMSEHRCCSEIQKAIGKLSFEGSNTTIKCITQHEDYQSLTKEYKSKYKKVGVLPIRIVWSNVSSIGPSSERNRK